MWKVPTLPFIWGHPVAWTIIFKRLVELIGPVTNKVMLYSLPSVDVQEAKTSAVRWRSMWKVYWRSLLMQPFLASWENRHKEASLEPHLCYDICAKKCRCLCSYKSKCTCDIVCNSEVFSPVEAISEKEGVKMTFPESGKAQQSLSP